VGREDTRGPGRLKRTSKKGENYEKVGDTLLSTIGYSRRLIAHRAQNTRGKENIRGGRKWEQQLVQRGKREGGPF